MGAAPDALGVAVDALRVAERCGCGGEGALRLWHAVVLADRDAWAELRALRSGGGADQSVFAGFRETLLYDAAFCAEVLRLCGKGAAGFDVEAYGALLEGGGVEGAEAAAESLPIVGSCVAFALQQANDLWTGALDFYRGEEDDLE